MNEPVQEPSIVQSAPEIKPAEPESRWDGKTDRRKPAEPAPQKYHCWNCEADSNYADVILESDFFNFYAICPACEAETKVRNLKPADQAGLKNRLDALE